MIETSTSEYTFDHNGRTLRRTIVTTTITCDITDGDVMIRPSVNYEAVGMGWETLVQMFKDAGTTMSAHSEALGKQRNHLSTAKRRGHPSADADVALFLGLPRYKIWPRRYTVIDTVIDASYPTSDDGEVLPNLVADINRRLFSTGQVQNPCGCLNTYHDPNTECQRCLGTGVDQYV